MQLAWKWIFVALVLGYGLVYAPFGTNETDGGFLTGLAWQLLQGKMLYRDIVYIRPPLPVWLRAIEMHVLPLNGAILAERWVFYLKMAIISCLGAAILQKANKQNPWPLACFAFVLSVHNYPAAAWHTVDGIFFASLGCWFLFQNHRCTTLFAAGAAFAAALLCKQSFYPLAPVFVASLLLLNLNAAGRIPKILSGLGGFVVVISLFFNYLYQNNLLSAYLKLTGGAATGAQALQHGLLDYFRISALYIGFSVVLLPPVVWYFLYKKQSQRALAAWALWLLLLLGGLAWTVVSRQTFTLPFAQTRLLFWIALAWRLWLWRRGALQEALRLGVLLSVSWCAALSWGYNLPILFALPGVYAVFEISRQLWQAVFQGKKSVVIALGALLLMLAVFRLAFEFVYRDGRRSQMSAPLGAVFPALTGIYSDAATADLYADLKRLAAQYGPAVKTMPAFPQANFLSQTRSPLPLDWVVAREMGAASGWVVGQMEQARPVFLIEKTYAGALDNSPELFLTRELLRQGQLLEETPHFWVLRGPLKLHIDNAADQ